MFMPFSSLLAKAFIVVAGIMTSIVPDIIEVAISKPATLPCLTLVYISPADTSQTKSPSSSKVSKKPSRSVTVTITDEGISVDGDELKKAVDINWRSEVQSKSLDSLAEKIDESVRKTLQSVPESIRSIIAMEGDIDRYKRIETSDVVRFGETITVERDKLVTGDVVAIRGDIKIDGKVTGDVVAIMGKVELGSEAIVNGDVVCVLGTLIREDGSIVRGETAVVGKSIKRNGGITFPLGSAGEGMISGFIQIGFLIVGIMISALLLIFIQRRMNVAAGYAIGSFLKSFGAGLLLFFGGMVIVTILAIIFAITIIGIPLAVLIVLCFLALLFIGYITSAIALGSLVARRYMAQENSLYLNAAIGLFLLAILGIVGAFMKMNVFLAPFGTVLGTIAGIAQFVALTTGTGAFVLSKAGSGLAIPRSSTVEPVSNP